MLLNNLVSRMVDGGILQIGGDNGGGPGSGGESATFFTLRAFNMHMGQLDAGLNGTVRQSVVLPHALKVALTKVNTPFNPAGAVSLTPATLNPLATPDFDLTTMTSHGPGLYSVTTTGNSHFLFQRHYDTGVNPGSSIGGAVIRNAAGHIVHNFGRKAGDPIIMLQGLGSQPSNYYDGIFDSRPLLLKNGALAGNLVTPMLHNGGYESYLSIIPPRTSLIPVDGEADHRLAVISGSSLGDTHPSSSYGCVTEHLTDGSLIVLHKDDGDPAKFKLLKFAAATASIDVIFAFNASLSGTARYKFSILTMPNGNYFVSWHNGPTDGRDGSDYFRCYYCIVAADLSSVLVAPTQVDTKPSTAQWFPSICLNSQGNVAVAWAEAGSNVTGNTSSIKICAKIFTQAGVELVSSAEIFETLAGGNLPTSAYRPLNTERTDLVSLDLVGNSLMLIVNQEGYQPQKPGFSLIAISDTTLNAVSSEFVDIIPTVNTAYNDSYYGTRPVQWISTAVVEDTLVVVATPTSSGGTRPGALYVFDEDCALLRSASIEMQLPTITNYLSSPIWLTNIGDGICQLSLLPEQSQCLTALIYADTLEIVADYTTAEDDNLLFLSLPGQFYIDARQEWDNTTFKLVKVSKAQAEAGEDFYETDEFGIASQPGTVAPANQNRFYVELNSDSFIVGSGYYSNDAGSGQTVSGTLCRIALDLARRVDGDWVTFRNVGYIDVNSDGTWTDPEFLTELSLLDRDTLQLRLVNHVGLLLNQFRVSEATATIVGEGEIALWT